MDENEEYSADLLWAFIGSVGLTKECEEFCKKKTAEAIEKAKAAPVGDRCFNWEGRTLLRLRRIRLRSRTYKGTVHRMARTAPLRQGRSRTDLGRIRVLRGRRLLVGTGVYGKVRREADFFAMKLEAS